MTVAGNLQPILNHIQETEQQPQHPIRQLTLECPATCSGDQTCDELIAVNPSLTCTMLGNAFFGCECTGCECGGAADDGSSSEVDDDSTSEVDDCSDSNDGAADPYGDGCDVYILDWCGRYDDDDFSSNEMCCLCQNDNAGSADDDATSGDCPSTCSGYYTCDEQLAYTGISCYMLEFTYSCDCAGCNCCEQCGR